MQLFDPKPPRNVKRRFIIWIFLLAAIGVLTSCIESQVPADGIVLVASRGNRPIAQSIAWSPTDQNKVLINAYETPEQSAEVFILDIQTGEKESVAGPLGIAQFIEAKWMPDGRRALILAVDTGGFEPSGWWTIDIGSKSAEHLWSLVDAIAWSPDGEFTAVLDRKLENGSSNMVLILTDTDTKDEQIVKDHSDMDYSGGMSWSADGKFVVYSVGKYQGPSNLFFLSIETKEVIRITDSGLSASPAWSPKGSIIAVESKDRLHLINSSGTCEAEIPDLANAWSPTWSPDGKKLGFIGSDGIYYLEIEKLLGRDIYQNLCQQKFKPSISLVLQRTSGKG